MLADFLGGKKKILSSFPLLCSQVICLYFRVKDLKKLNGSSEMGRQDSPLTMWWPSQTVYLGKLQIAISFWPLSWLVRFPGLEGDGPAPSILRTVITRARVWGRGDVAALSVQPLCAKCFPCLQGAAAPAGTSSPPGKTRGTGRNWGLPFLLSRISLFLFPFFVLLILKGRVFLKPIFYWFTGVLAEIGRRCLCSDYHLYPEVCTTDI